ncbi:MAG TPA: chorismate synthase [Rhabdochlamydiaceae bacterium]|jgi:chorismate synthase
MSNNSFGKIFRITTWGESHGQAIGVVIDGCPAGLPLEEEEIQCALVLRRPGRNAWVSPRKEDDRAYLYSGVFEGKTTGAPISIVIKNEDANSSAYAATSHLLRPGHANFTFLEKYGIFDFRGGGRASARETACRVAAGAVAKKLLEHYGISLLSYIKEIGGIASADPDWKDFSAIKGSTLESPLFCPDSQAALLMQTAIEKVKEERDSLGGIIETIALSLPAGLGDPVYEKLEANLAKAMLSLPASKGFEVGCGFKAAQMRGSQHNDLFYLDTEGKIATRTNCAGGTLGGISTGMPLIFRVTFKPTSSIAKAQQTLTVDKQEQEFSLGQEARHDPCVAVRATPVVEAMAALVIADALLLNRCSRL